MAAPDGFDEEDFDAIDAEGEAALAAMEEEELSAHDAIAELQRRGARPVLNAETPIRGAAPSGPAPGSAAAPGSAPAAPVTGSTPPAATSAESGTCTDCQNARSQAKFYEAFELRVCYDCQRANRGKYQLITKSKAKDEYLLNDRQLDETRGGLGNMRLPNPHDKRHADMRMYLRAQVEQLAFATWGSSEELLLEKEQRSENRLERAESKRRLKSGTAEEQVLARCGGHGGASKAQKKQKKGRAGAGAGGEGSVGAVPAVVRSAPRHTHEFLPEEEYCESTDMWTKRCACGFAVEYEKL
jgi:DNA-repair protein complementing XP-A cells